MTEPKADSKVAAKPEAPGGRQGILAAFGNATRAYGETLHDAWLALNNAGRDAQNELLVKITAANATAAGSTANERFAKAHQAYMAAQRAVVTRG